jgi:hypothetical protein
MFYKSNKNGENDSEIEEDKTDLNTSNHTRFNNSYSFYENK